MFTKEVIKTMKETPTTVEVEPDITVESYHPLMFPKEMYLRVTFTSYKFNSRIGYSFTFAEWGSKDDIQKCIETASDEYGEIIALDIQTRMHKTI